MCLVEVMLKELTGIFFFSTHSLYFHYYYYHRFLLSFLCVSFFLFFLFSTACASFFASLQTTWTSTKQTDEADGKRQRCFQRLRILFFVTLRRSLLSRQGCGEVGSASHLASLDL